MDLRRFSLSAQALSKANQAQNKAKDATRKVEQAKKELEDIAAILATVQEPGWISNLDPFQEREVFCNPGDSLSEPGLLEELARRLEDAEREFQAQDLDQKLTDLEAAKQRQVLRFLCVQESN